MAIVTSTDVVATAPRLRLLVLQPTPFCNIDCSYCYLSNRKSAARMSLETLDLACRCVFESQLLDRQLEVAWHGGEPLVVPLAWYEEAIALIAKRRPATLQLKHCFQTNGLLVNEDWARFFARTEARIGLSIDGPADLHDANRRTRRGHGTHEGAMRAVRLLQDQDLGFHVITVLTEVRSMIRTATTSMSKTDQGSRFQYRGDLKEYISSSSLAGGGVDTRFRRFISALILFGTRRAFLKCAKSARLGCSYRTNP
jgi:uncharacterized protein